MEAQSHVFLRVARAIWHYYSSVFWVLRGLALELAAEPLWDPLWTPVGAQKQLKSGQRLAKMDFWPSQESKVGQQKGV